MKRIARIIVYSLLLLPSLSASAVTEAEMEKARVIAAKTYLRYANNGSGYLDEFTVASLSELEPKLKAKEKENLKAFKAIPVPSDYKTWDKDKLVEYWSTTAFSTKGLLKDGLVGKYKAKKLLSKMTVSAPQKEAPKPAAESPEKESPQTVANKTDSPAGKETSNPDSKENAAVASPEEMTPLSEAEALLAQIPASDELDEPIKKERNLTWLYIVILVILIGVVVWLVVFASNTLKKNAGKDIDDESKKASPVFGGDPDLREKYAAKLAEKNDEIRTLSAKAESLERRNEELRRHADALASELNALKKHMQNPAAGTERAVAVGQDPTRREEPRSEYPRSKEARREGERAIYLGRATGRGVFICADRMLNPSHSIFRLVTDNGYTGTFRVVNDAEVWDNALTNPEENLLGACLVQNIDSAPDASRIATDSAGTAIFENSAWRVIRKAKVHFE